MQRVDFAHSLRLLTLLTSACLTMPVLMKKPLFKAGTGTSDDAEDPQLSRGEKLGSVIVIGERNGLEADASRDAVRAGLGRIEALVLGRRISR